VYLKQVLVLVVLLILLVAASSICVYSIFFNQLVIPFPTIRASDSNNLGSVLDGFNAEEELVVVVKRGETTILRDDNQELFTIKYTPDELDALFKVGTNLAFNLNAEQSGQSWLTRLDAQFPLIRENIYLVGRFIDNLPFGLKFKIAA
jgi:hypothetical protein